MTPQEIHDALKARYAGKRVAIQFSAGLDSATLAYQVLLAGASKVALICLDPGQDNNHKDPFARLDDPEDMVRDQEQFLRYARLINNWMLKNEREDQFEILEMRSPLLNSMTVKPEYLRVPDNEVAANAEANYGTVFYAGFVMNHMSLGLSVAAANGYDYVLTGHMGWNSHYEDESADFAAAISDLFAKTYGSRLKTVPRVEMPYRDLGIQKVDLVRMNDTEEFYFASHLHTSCAPGVVVYGPASAHLSDVKIGYKLDPRGVQYHCGKCEHCEQRRDAYREAGVMDTAAYAN